MNVSVIGLGKLGSPMAALFAAKGHRVFAVDVNERFVQSINQNIAPVFEPGLQEMLNQTAGRLTASTDLSQAVLQSDATFLIVPTPSDGNGAFSMKFVLEAAQQIGQTLKQKKNYHRVILTSTVMPGATGSQLLPTLERASGKTCPQDFGLIYSPEFISLGSVLKDMLHPDFVLIGESDPESGAWLAAFYKGITNNHPKVARMNFANAELTKLALNTFVTTKISYANMLAEICEHLEGGNVDAVTTALGMDSRIGPKYLKGGMGYGGPCFPRDNIALTTLAKSLGVDAPLPATTDKINNSQVLRLVGIIQNVAPKDAKVGILGLAYKPQTNVVEKSQGLELALTLTELGRTVTVYDPCAMDMARSVLPESVQFTANVNECVASCDVLVVTLPYEEFKTIHAADLRRVGVPRIVIDCWRQLDRASINTVCRYIALGTSDVQSASQAMPLDEAHFAELQEYVALRDTIAKTEIRRSIKAA